MAVKALVHLRFMESRRNLDRTTGITKKHSYQYDTAPPVLAKASAIAHRPWAHLQMTGTVCQDARSVQYTWTTAALLAPVQIQR